MLTETRAGRTTAEFVVDIAPDAVVGRLLRALLAQRRFTVESSDAVRATISARPNWATWGGRVELAVLPDEADAHRTRVRARWSPALPTTVVTWGQGRRDLAAIAGLLQGDSEA